MIYADPAADREFERLKRERAALALDQTHPCGERGPRTLRARRRVAEALDGQCALLWSDVLWLEQVAATTTYGS